MTHVDCRELESPELVSCTALAGQLGTVTHVDCKELESPELVEAVG